jgi:uncharacterized membrane protein
MSEERRFPWRTLLFVSTALNLLMIGAAIGALGAGVRLERQTSGAVVDRMPGTRAFIAALPSDVQPQIRAELARGWVQSREARRAAARARREAFVAASTEPYDVARVSAAFARMRAADQAAVGVFHDNVAEAFAQLTPEQRRQALAALRRAPPARRADAPMQDDAAASADAPLIEGDAEQADPATQQSLRERRREAIRERLRQRREGNP